MLARRHQRGNTLIYRQPQVRSSSGHLLVEDMLLALITSSAYQHDRVCRRPGPHQVSVHFCQHVIPVSARVQCYASAEGKYKDHLLYVLSACQCSLRGQAETTLDFSLALPVALVECMYHVQELGNRGAALMAAVYTYRSAVKPHYQVIAELTFADDSSTSCTYPSQARLVLQEINETGFHQWPLPLWPVLSSFALMLEKL